MHIFRDSRNPHPKRDIPDSLKKTPTPAIQSFFDESLGMRLGFRAVFKRFSKTLVF